MARAPFNVETGVGEPILGYFTESDIGNQFDYSMNDELILAPKAQGGKNVVFPHKVWVGPLGEYRHALVLKTCVHIITNETDFGWVVEKWNIKKHRKF